MVFHVSLHQNRKEKNGCGFQFSITAYWLKIITPYDSALLGPARWSSVPPCLPGLQSSEGLIKLQWSKMPLPLGRQLMLAASWKLIQSCLTQAHVHSPSLQLGLLIAWHLSFKSILTENTLKLPDFHNACLHSEVFECCFLCIALFKAVIRPVWL